MHLIFHISIVFMGSLNDILVGSLVHKCDTSMSHMLKGLFTNCDI